MDEMDWTVNPGMCRFGLCRNGLNHWRPLIIAKIKDIKAKDPIKEAYFTLASD